MTEYGRIHTDGSRSGGQPMPATEKAHKAIIEVLVEWGLEPRNATAQQLAVATTEALCRAIDKLEDHRQPTQSNAVVKLLETMRERCAHPCRSEKAELGCDCDAARQAAVMLRQPTQSDALQAENEDLRHDLERQMTIANEHVNEVERLREALEQIAFSGADGPYGYFGEALNEHQMRRVAKAALRTITRLKKNLT